MTKKSIFFFDLKIPLSNLLYKMILKSSKEFWFSRKTGKLKIGVTTVALARVISVPL